MANTEFKFKPETIKAETEAMKKSMLDRNVKGTIVSRFAEIVEKNFHGNPKNYREYGPYWWAVKEILIREGVARGNAVNPEIAKEYRGDNDEETIIAALKFQRLHRAQFFAFTNNFALDLDAGEDWYLYDPDYEDDKPEE